MPLGLSSVQAALLLDSFLNNTAFTGPAAIWVKLHLGDPGAAGTTSPATNTTRQQADFSAASGGAITSNASITWTNVPATEDYTHFSCWTASSGGTFLFSGSITANQVTSGDDFVVPAGDLDVSFTNVAS
jgi:hypothetical protein